MLEFAFMRRSLIIGIMLAIIIPMIGIIMINRKTSMIGDALSHSSLAGIGLGLIFGINPLWTSLVICIIASFAIETLRKKFPKYGDMATAIVMSTGIAIASILSDFTPGGTSFESFMFGSITTVSSEDVYIVLFVFLIVAISSLYLYYGLLYTSINPVLARLAGVNTSAINIFFTLLTAVTVAISAKTVGALMVTSLMTIPVAGAMVFAKSYKKMYIISIILSVIFMVSGISASYYLGIKPGGAIVIIAVISFLIISLVNYFKN
ncbi:metal ABC transporter permease [Anaerococcus urinomassiliensis]|uniref:metal ABC transporter permease n=1 Tax=Anaerococcus urinomassiliensis TaxID=1745712 RepID=UPI00093A4AB6|nr:metal ABC transporter permease [Anaerococcus urinomassiliensis]